MDGCSIDPSLNPSSPSWQLLLPTDAACKRTHSTKTGASTVTRCFRLSDVTDVAGSLVAIDCCSGHQSLGVIPLADGLKLMSQAETSQLPPCCVTVSWEGMEGLNSVERSHRRMFSPTALFVCLLVMKCLNEAHCFTNKDMEKDDWASVRT